jgi:hypothetical protein
MTAGKLVCISYDEFESAASLTHSEAHRLYLIRRHLPISLSKLSLEPYLTVSWPRVICIFRVPLGRSQALFNPGFLCVCFPYFKFPTSRILDHLFFSFPNISSVLIR